MRLIEVHLWKWAARSPVRPQNLIEKISAMPVPVFMLMLILIAVFPQQRKADRISTTVKRVDPPASGKAHARAAGSAEFQRDPRRLIREFSLDMRSRQAPFDFSLITSRLLGEEAAAKLSPKQKGALRIAFQHALSGIWETWNESEPEMVRILRSEIESDRATVTLLRGEELIRMRLEARNGVWFITEHEWMDEAWPAFASGYADALAIGLSLQTLYRMPTEKSLERIAEWIAKNGEGPELLLAKYRMLEAAHLAGTVPPSEAADNALYVKRLDEILYRLTTRWPHFAPGRLARARMLLYSSFDEETTINPVSQDPEEAILELKEYARLIPFDPRPYRDLAYAYEQMEKFEDAEAAFRKAIELDPQFMDHYQALIMFYLLSEDVQTARRVMDQMLQAAPTPEDAFGALLANLEEEPTADEGRAFESILLSFPDQLNRSHSGLSLLTMAYNAQNKFNEAVKTLRRALALEESAEDYAYLSTLLRKVRRFPEAADAADQALRLDPHSGDAWFERACSLAQLGRKREALAALKQMLRLDPQNSFAPDEPDLWPLAASPEFQAIVQKMRGLSPAAKK
jgi:tetratricopeptide (TPR) repeat protein